MKDPRPEVISSVELERTGVLPGKPIVFVFGGQIDYNSSGKSVRSDLVRHISANRPSLNDALVLPEDFTDWLHDSIYPDLLTFERELAATASLVVIALESPGAIAELGAFSIVPEIRKKLMIVLSTTHYEQKSFITLGPLRLLDNDRSIVAYPYEYGSKLTATLADHLEDITESIESEIRNVQKRIGFTKEDVGHIAFLVNEMLQLFRALLLTEIETYLSSLGVPVTRAQLKRILFLLQKIEIIDVKRMGQQDFFFSKRTERWIDLVGKRGTKFERTAVRVAVSAYYENATTETKRKKFVRRYLD